MSDHVLKCRCGLTLVGDISGEKLKCPACNRTSERCDCKFNSMGFDPDEETLHELEHMCHVGHEDDIVRIAKELEAPPWYVRDCMRTYNWSDESMDSVCQDLGSVYDAVDATLNREEHLECAPTFTDRVKNEGETPSGAAPKDEAAPKGPNRRSVMTQATETKTITNGGATVTTVEPGSAVKAETPKTPVMGETPVVDNCFNGGVELYSPLARNLNETLMRQLAQGETTPRLFWSAAFTILMIEGFSPLFFVFRRLFIGKNWKLIEAKVLSWAKGGTRVNENGATSQQTQNQNGASAAW